MTQCVVHDIDLEQRRCTRCGMTLRDIQAQVHNFVRKVVVQTATQLDELDARLRDGDPDAGPDARRLLHGLVKRSNYKQLRALLAGVRAIVDRDLRETSQETRNDT